MNSAHSAGPSAALVGTLTGKFAVDQISGGLQIEQIGGVLQPPGSFQFLTVGEDDGQWQLTGSTVPSVPVPAALPLLISGIGLVGLLGIRRRARAV